MKKIIINLECKEDTTSFCKDFIVGVPVMLIKTVMLQDMPFVIHPNCILTINNGVITIIEYEEQLCASDPVTGISVIKNEEKTTLNQLVNQLKNYIETIGIEKYDNIIVNAYLHLKQKKLENKYILI